MSRHKKIIGLSLIIVGVAMLLSTIIPYAFVVALFVISIGLVLFLC